MFKIFSFSFIYFFIDKTIKFINSIFFIILALALTFALIISPPDYLQGDVVRIMYVHVPSAWIGLACYSTIVILSILHFVFKIKNFILINKSIVPIGLLFTCLAVVTGSIWGQPTWGTWWAWDARLTSMIILLFFYLFYILALKFIKSNTLSIKISSIIAIIGAINLPIIKYSVDWWNALHQPASIKLDGTTSIHASMMLPLLLMLLVYYYFCYEIHRIGEEIET